MERQPRVAKSQRGIEALFIKKLRFYFSKAHGNRAVVVKNSEKGNNVGGVAMYCRNMFSTGQCIDAGYFFKSC
jgi:hypothetical protein